MAKYAQRDLPNLGPFVEVRIIYDQSMVGDHFEGVSEPCRLITTFATPVAGGESLCGVAERAWNIFCPHTRLIFCWSFILPRHAVAKQHA